MAKRGALKKELDKEGGKLAPVTDANAEEQTGGIYKPPSRRGKITFAMHVAPAVRTQMKMLALERGETVQKLMEEAVNDLFAKYDKPQIAGVQNEE